MKTLCSHLLLGLSLAVSSLPAANIAWVSDVNDPFVGFSPPGSPNVVPYSDQGFVDLLLNAGHNVIRYNGPASQNTLLSQTDIDALNTNDLIIIARVANSGAWQAPQGPQWNTNITKPLICMSPYLVRTLATGNRMGWFTAANLPDSTPTRVWAVDPTLAVTDYILGGIAMVGTNSVYVFDELLDRNTSFITDPPVAGGRVLVSATFGTEANTNTIVTGAVIAEFPAGTAVRGGLDILPAYRMYFSGGSREAGTAPGNNINLNAGRETLSPAGENIFLRAVDVAVNSGAPPASDPNAPIGFTAQPASATVLQNLPVTFSISVTGAAPRTLQWQRDIGDGVTFTNIPDASTTFSVSEITLPNVTLADDGARFRVEASNAQGAVHSAVATLTVTPDTAPPVPLSAASIDGSSITICFNELLDNKTENNSAEEEFNYLIDNSGPPMLATLRPDGKSVVLALATPVGPTFTVRISYVEDRLANPMGADVEVTGTNHGLTSVGVGAPNPAGSSFSCASNTFEINGGGLDLQNTTDQFQFLYRTVSGDFDARVRVTSLTYSNASQGIEVTTKALLTTRATADGNSAAVNIYVTPPYPANHSVLATFRPTAGADTTTNSSAFVPNGLPNAWLRITRVGDAFTTFRSTDGTTWTEMSNTTVALGPSAVVGMGALSRRNGRLASATFSDFRIIQAPTQPQLTNPSYSGSAFSASFQTQNGVDYEVQYNDDLNGSTWTTLTTVIGDGTVQTVSDPGPLPAKRFYRLRTLTP